MIIELKSGTPVPFYHRITNYLEAQTLGVTDDNGWLFSWDPHIFTDYSVIGLYTLDYPSTILGLMALQVYRTNMEIEVLETAPLNRFQHPHRIYAGVGKTLVATACLLSFQSNCDTVTLYPKDYRVANYYLALGAEQGPHGELFFDRETGYNLIARCLGGV